MAKPEYYALNKVGTSGPDVGLIQIWLNGAHEMYPCVKKVSVDGKFGPKTQESVKAFQCVTGLSVDGIVGENTWNMLYNRYADSVGPGEQYPGVAMRNGDRGATVKSAQLQLTANGYAANADGIMGQDTVDAVKSFQHGASLSADGVIGTDTWTKLYA